MTTENLPFEPDSLEFKIVQGIFNHINLKMSKGAFDIYRNFGIFVKGELVLKYKIEEIKLLADYIRNNQEYYKFETLEYLPSAFDFNTQ